MSARDLEMTTGTTLSISSTILSHGLTLWGKKGDYKKVLPRISNDNAIYLGEKQIKDLYGDIVKYEGEILDGDQATGIGEYTDQVGRKFSGHFVNSMIEGAGTSSPAN